MTPAVPSDERTGRWLAEQRWFARPSDADPAAVPELGAAVRAPIKRGVDVALLTVGEDRYQLLQAGSAPDAAAEPTVAGALARFVAANGRVLADDGTEVRGRWIGPKAPGRAAARPLGAEQSNTSLAVGGTHVLKVLRRVAPGVHPEVEVGVHLAGVPDAPVAPLAGWYDLVEHDGTTTTLGLVHELVPGALDGWGLVLSALAADPGAILARLRDLGEAVARLHGALARPGDPDGFGVEPLAGTEVWALADRILVDPLTPAAAHPLVARLVEGIGTDAGAAIRTHGDLHLGQTLVGRDGWVIIDFEGEPARSIAERRARTSPLRDVAGMLRSLSYAVAAHERSGSRPLSPGWEPAARAALLDGYLATLDPALLPRSMAAAHRLLTLLELEKVVYELAYERAHRPDWVAIPERGLAGLLDRSAP